MPKLAPVLPLVIDWTTLVKVLGWPYSKTNTKRMMAKVLKRTRGSIKKGTFEAYDFVNPDPFPKARKPGYHPNAPMVWLTLEVLDYYERHDIPVPRDWYASLQGEVNEAAE